MSCSKAERREWVAGWLGCHGEGREECLVFLPAFIFFCEVWPVLSILIMPCPLLYPFLPEVSCLECRMSNDTKRAWVDSFWGVRFLCRGVLQRGALCVAIGKRGCLLSLLPASKARGRMWLLRVRSIDALKRAAAAAKAACSGSMEDRPCEKVLVLA